MVGWCGKGFRLNHKYAYYVSGPMNVMRGPNVTPKMHIPRLDSNWGSKAREGESLSVLVDLFGSYLPNHCVILADKIKKMKLKSWWG